MSNHPSPLSNDGHSDSQSDDYCDDHSLSPAIKATVVAGSHRQLALPLLLFLVGHRPLAFITGQFLHLCVPGSALLGWPQIEQWASLLSHPNGPQVLEQELRQVLSQ